METLFRAGASWRKADGLQDMREDVAVGRVARLRRAEVNEVDNLAGIDDGDVFPQQRRESEPEYCIESTTAGRLAICVLRSLSRR